MDDMHTNRNQPKPAGQADRRQSARRTASLSVDMVILDHHGEPTGRVTLGSVDLSEGGVGVISPMSLDDGTPTMLIIHSHSSPMPSLIYAEVTGSTPRPDGRFQIGMKFRPMPVSMLDHKWLSLMLLKAMAA